MGNKKLRAAPTWQECVWVATLKKPIGIAGRIAFMWRGPSFFEHVQIGAGDFIFLERDGLLVPYELVDWEERGDGSVSVQLAMVQTATEARELQGLRLFVDRQRVSDTLNSTLREEDLEAWLVGQYVEDEYGQCVGRVLRVDQYSMNTVLTVMRQNGDEVLLPLSVDLLIEMPKQPEPSSEFPLRLRIPQGLL